MANITQTIPALTAGISQQPDEQKIPGQVKNMVNALPDVTRGLLKRPAGKFVASLSDGAKNSSTDGKWFHYYRDENEQYIGQIHRDGTVRMWDCLTGNEKNVVDGIGNNLYLTHNDDEDIQTLTLNDFTYINNRSVVTRMDPDTAEQEPLGDFGKEIFVELKSISYAKQYALNVFDSNDPADLRTVTTATRITVERVKDSNNYCQVSNLNPGGSLMNGHMVEHTTGGDSGIGRIGEQGRCTANALDGRDAYAPNVGTRIFNVGSGTSLVDANATGGIYNYWGGGAAQLRTDINYSYNVAVYDNTNYGTHVGGARVPILPNNTLADRSNLYFRIVTTAQSVPYTEGSGTNQTTNYQARYTTTYDLLHGGEGWQEGDWFHVWMKDAYYMVTIDEVSTSKVQANLALVRPNPTPFDTETTITAESIIGSIRSELIATSNFDENDITQIGTGLHIKYDSNFNASTPVGELLNVVSGKVNDVGDLPSQCKHGMVVEVINSEAEEDNHFVKFFGKQKADGTYVDGEGTWEECAQPGRTIKFDYSRMPVVLIRTADGNFRLTELDGTEYTVQTNDGPVTSRVPQWDNALVGDDVTNAEPSFIGKHINKMLFFRNRFAILADEYIVMSRPGDFTNFWAKSAIQLVASDPIDISASSEYPAILYDGIQTNTGLVLFSKNQQFMLTTDSDVFSPLTAKINALSTYNFNYSTNPISLGTTLGFLDNAGKYSRFFEMAQVQREGEPQVIEQSAVVSRLFEKDLKLISNSRENSVIFFSEEGTSTLYGYRYFDQITERKLASWFKWTLTGTIQYHCMQDDFLYVVVRNNGKDQLLKYAIKIDSDTRVTEDEEADHRVHLDHLMYAVLPISATDNNGVQTVGYNRDNNVTFFPKPVGLESTTHQLAVYSVDPTITVPGLGVYPSDSLKMGRFAKATINGNSIEIEGDFRSTEICYGYLYTMEVELPTIYYVTQSGENWRADTRANTILHRVKFGFGPIGLYETTLRRTGRVDYTEVFELTEADSYQADRSSIVNDNNLRTVPIYDRNINTNLTIKSTHPAPATIHNMTWEGVYNNNFYQRV